MLPADCNVANPPDRVSLFIEMKSSRDDSETGRGKDPRWDALATVWWGVVAMLAVCIPLVFVTRLTMLPVFVLGAGVVATAIVLGGHRSSRAALESEAERERLEGRIRELEERLANVEVIESFENRLAEKELERRRREEADRTASAPRHHGSSSDASGDGARSDGPLSA